MIGIEARDEYHFTGDWVDASGKNHCISRVTCNVCHQVLSEMHYGCCGHAACGTTYWYHECPGVTP